MNSDKLRFYQLLEQHVGIALDETKEYLLESRLAPLSQELSEGNVDSLLRQLVNTPVDTLHWRAFEALTTNETSFFRDRHVFEGIHLDLLPDLIARRRNDRSLTIWSSAVSAGQEAYSLAMLIREHFPELRDWRIHIEGTDISDLVLGKARLGIYSEIEVNRGLEKHYLKKYFTRLDNETYRVIPTIRAMVSFSVNNLIGKWPHYPKFDLILLRNVLIYFRTPTRELVLGRIGSQLADDCGLLLLGAAESILADRRFELIQKERYSCYRLANSTNRKETGVKT